MPAADQIARPTINNPASKALVDMYAAKAEKGEPSKAYSLPLYSLGCFSAEVVEASGDVSYAVFRRNDEISFFTYAQSSQIPSGLAAPNQSVTATLFHTNLTEPSKTPMNMDFAIELLVCSFLPPQFSFGSTTPTITNQAVISAFRGDTVLVDPAATFIPPEGHSPFNLEALIDSNLRQSVSLSMGWGDGRSEDPLGMLDGFHDGLARSYLKAAGVPQTGNGMYQPEGHLWRGTALGSDSKFQMKARLERDVIVKLSGRTWPGGTSATHPTRLIQWIKISLFGLGMIPLGTNA